MWLVGLRLYTSVGWDAEEVIDGRIKRSYYRVRWPGDGDFWVGGGAYYLPRLDRPVKSFDPASTSFVRPRHLPEPHSAWNHVGFWLLPDPAIDPCDRAGAPRLLWGWWLGVPGWLPGVLLGLWPACSLWQRLRRGNEPVRK
jgi:hypothetical protein